MTKVISLFNQVGGAAKSTSTHNIGYHLAQRDRKVLLVDLDPQGTLTLFCGHQPENLIETVADIVLSEEISKNVPIIKGDNFDLLPSNISLSAAEMMLITADMRDLRLKDALSPILDDYDFILIDCLPSLGILSYIALVASSYVLVPIECEYKAFAGTNLLMQTIKRVRGRANRKLKIAGFIPTKYDARRSQHKRTLESIHQRFDTVSGVLPPIPASTDFADASEKGMCLYEYKPKHKAIAVLDEIAEYLLTL